MENEEELLELAEVCRRRTRGNPCFIQEFVKMLKDEGLLTYNIDLLQWQFQIPEISQLASATGNVVEMIQKKMEYVGRETHLGQLLTVAACLGSAIPYSILAVVWPEFVDYNSDYGYDLRYLLDTAVDEGFLDRTGEPSAHCYVWIHDSIQISALSPTAEYELRKMKFRLGKLLLRLRDS